MILFMVGLLLGAGLLKYDMKREARLQQQIADKVLRFHVLANSDSAEDQAVKLKVRDAVGEYLSTYLSEATSKEESKNIISNHMEEIVQVAENVIGEEGYDYNVSAQILWTDFPKKTYGSYSFPKGEYEALQICLGEAKGHNWWCVLYPNMCFYGSMYEVVEEEAKEELKSVLNAEEYKEIIDEGDYKIRLKFLELFEGRD